MSTPLGKRTREVIPWRRGRCEYWLSDRVMCGKPGRWMVQNHIRCGEHKDAEGGRA